MSRLFTDKGKIICPQCELEQDVLAFTPLKNLLPDETAEIIKCRNCRFVFAPMPKFLSISPENNENEGKNL